MKKLLSIVVPVFKVEDYICKCLDSLVLDDAELMNQFEVIIVNDGTPDRSAEFSREYVEKYPGTFKQIDKENGNYGSCINAALKVATGKYFRMLDADDWADKNALSTWLEKLQECEADLVVTEATDIYVDGSIIQHMSIPEQVIEGYVYPVEEFDGIKLGLKYLYCSHILTYRTELLRRINLSLQEGISYTDNEYVFFPLDHIKTAVCFRLPFYQYLNGREGQTTNAAVMQKSVSQMYRVLGRLLKYFVENATNQIPSVANNQRLVLSTIIGWLYNSCFVVDADENMKLMISDIERRIVCDKELFDMTSGFGNKYGISLLKRFREKGQFVDNPCLRKEIQIHRVCRKFARILHLMK